MSGSPTLGDRRQLLIVWSAIQHDSRSLPSSIASYRQFRNNWPTEGVEIVVIIRKSIDRQTVSDIEFIDRESGELVASIEGFESTVDAALQSAFASIGSAPPSRRYV